MDSPLSGLEMWILELVSHSPSHQLHLGREKFMLFSNVQDIFCKLMTNIEVIRDIDNGFSRVTFFPYDKIKCKLILKDIV